MRHVLVALTLSLLAAGCGDDDTATTETPDVTTTTEAEGYATFDDVDPDTDEYFISLEDSDLQASSDELIWKTGVSVCESMDDGATVDEELDRVQNDLGFTAAPAIIASAASHICDQHEQTVRDWVEANI